MFFRVVIFLLAFTLVIPLGHLAAMAEIDESGFPDPLEKIFRSLKFGMSENEVYQEIQKRKAADNITAGSSEFRWIRISWRGKDILMEEQTPWVKLCILLDQGGYLVGAQYIFNYAGRLVENRIEGKTCWWFLE